MIRHRNLRALDWPRRTGAHSSATYATCMCLAIKRLTKKNEESRPVKKVTIDKCITKQKIYPRSDTEFYGGIVFFSLVPGM
jgi:hypothetical protein